MTKTLIGIGNAAIDGMVDVDSDQTLRDLGLVKGTCVFCRDDDPRMKRVFDKFPDFFKEAGGAAANALSAYGALGGQARFVGKIGLDDYGDYFKSSMHSYGVTFDTSPTTESQSTFLFAVVTPDRERSFLSNHGASHYISAQDIKETWFTPDTSLIIDGYMLMSDGGPDAMFQAMDYASKHGSDIIFMPCSLTVILEKNEFVKQIMAKASSIICNQEEALAITRSDNIDDIASHFDWGVVTLGERGAFYFHDNKKGIIPLPRMPQKILNTNGAGDNFAGGCLYGLHHGMSIENAVKLGQLCAIHVIERPGARCETNLKHLLESF
jgi:sugar/nucleoside kinase (ribokinase family)